MYPSTERYAPAASDSLELAVDRAGRVARVLLCLPIVVAIALYIDDGTPDGQAVADAHGVVSEIAPARVPEAASSDADKSASDDGADAAARDTALSLAQR